MIFHAEWSVKLYEGVRNWMVWGHDTIFGGQIHSSCTYPSRLCNYFRILFIAIERKKFANRSLPRFLLYYFGVSVDSFPSFTYNVLLLARFIWGINSFLFSDSFVFLI